MGTSFCFPWEIPFMQWIQTAECSAANILATIFSMLGEEYLILLIVGLCYWCIDKRLGRNISLALTGAMLSGSLIKGLVQRRRPYMDHPEIRCIRAAQPDADISSVVAQGYSFPSLHASFSAGAYGAMGLQVKKTAAVILAFMLPLLIGLSRIYLGVHYPTDVFSGWVLGAMVALLFYFLEKKRGYKACFILQLAVGAFGVLYCRDNEYFSILGVLLGAFFGFLYEEKYVGFAMSKKWWSFILRPVFGLAIFAIMSTLLKLPVKQLPADRFSAFQFAYRTFRYALSSFVIIGLYPRLFKKARSL